MKKQLIQLLDLGTKDPWWKWVMWGWASFLLVPFAAFGENWGMVWFIVAWPFSEAMERLHETFGVGWYVGLASLIDTAFIVSIALVASHGIQMIRDIISKPPTTPTGKATT